MLDFSRDGSKLAILMGVPDFRIVIWDLEENCHLCEVPLFFTPLCPLSFALLCSPSNVQGALEAAPPHLIRLNPVNDRQLISVSTSFVHFWNVDSLLDSHEMTKRE